MCWLYLAWGIGRQIEREKKNTFCDIFPTSFVAPAVLSKLSSSWTLLSFLLSCPKTFLSHNYNQEFCPPVSFIGWALEVLPGHLYQDIYHCLDLALAAPAIVQCRIHYSRPLVFIMKYQRLKWISSEIFYTTTFERVG